MEKHVYPLSAHVHRHMQQHDSNSSVSRAGMKTRSSQTKRKRHYGEA